MGEGVHTISKGVKTDRSYQRDTEKGMNKQESYTVNKIEAKIRNRKTEKGYVIGSNGQIIAESHRSGRQSATFYASDMKKDAIVTHNHPYVGNRGARLFDTMAGRIGVPFSMGDVNNAVSSDLKEIRAVTPTYTFSLRRPKGGWGDREKINRALSEYNNSMMREVGRYVQNQRNSSRSSYQRAKEVSDRANVGVQYSAIKKLAKQFGWEFTRKKVK